MNFQRISQVDYFEKRKIYSYNTGQNVNKQAKKKERAL